MSRVRLWSLVAFLGVGHVSLLAVRVTSDTQAADRALLLAATVIGPAAAFAAHSALTGTRHRRPSTWATRINVVSRILLAGAFGFATAAVAVCLAPILRTPTPCDVDPECAPPEVYILVVFSAMVILLAALGAISWAISAVVRSRSRDELDAITVG